MDDRRPNEADTANADAANVDTANAETANAETANAETAGADTTGADTASADTAGAETGNAAAEGGAHAGSERGASAGGPLGVAAVAAGAHGIPSWDREDADGGLGEVRALLRGYRPVGPPASLRARIVEAPAPVPAPGRVWPWLVAAAALFVAALGLRVEGDGLIAQTGATWQPARPDPAAAIADLAQTLGGDDRAWRAATLVVRQEEQRQEERRRERQQAARAAEGASAPAPNTVPAVDTEEMP